MEMPTFYAVVYSGVYTHKGNSGINDHGIGLFPTKEKAVEKYKADIKDAIYYFEHELQIPCRIVRQADTCSIMANDDIHNDIVEIYIAELQPNCEMQNYSF